MKDKALYLVDCRMLDISRSETRKAVRASFDSFLVLLCAFEYVGLVSTNDAISLQEKASLQVRETLKGLPDD